MKFIEFGLHHKVLKSIERLGYKRPTDIQYKSIPAILEGEDVLAIAQTGTGKTAAFAIPVIHLLETRKRGERNTGTRCVVMAPTHELAVQITEEFIRLGKDTKLSFLTIIGGVDQAPQIERLKAGVDVLVATPGRLFDLVNQGHLKIYQSEILILDEADHMLDLGFYKDIQDLIKYLPKKRQTLFFSATIDAKIKKLAYSLVSKPIRIQISPKDPVAKNVIHSVAHINMDDKRFFLERTVHENPESKILIFVRTKVRAERVKKAMERVEIDSVTIHSDKTQDERFEAMTKFRSGEINIMIATDVSARGIDIPNVDFVINYDLPDKTENYVHRVGRTGRAKHKGFAVSYCSEEEKGILKEIEDYLGKPINVVHIAGDEYADTLAFSKEESNDWKNLMKDAIADEEEYEAMKKKRKGRKKNK